MLDQRPHVIIAGFGIAGRFVAELLQKAGCPFLLVELNSQTCEAQAALGVEVIHGDISDERILRQAGVETASILALTIPDEQAAIRAAAAANAIRPDIHIIGWTQYTSTSLQALQAGADEVIVAEHAIAQEFYRRIARVLRSPLVPSVEV
jgi:CPA2 family monovalent cation:H+ antiporter-2